MTARKTESPVSAPARRRRIECPGSSAVGEFRPRRQRHPITCRLPYVLLGCPRRPEDEVAEPLPGNLAGLGRALGLNTSNLFLQAREG